MKTNWTYSKNKHLDHIRFCGKCPTKAKFINSNLEQSNTNEFNIARAIKYGKFTNNIIAISPEPIIPIRNKF